MRVSAGLAGTHLLHLCIRRWRWLHLPGGSLVVHLISLGTLLAALIASVETAVSPFLAHDTWYRPAAPRRLLLNWIAWLIILSGWTTLYVMIHEFRGRRVREMLGLRLEMMVQEAQLRGLRAQLNPHFFFNCLNSLREVIAENPERAQLMVTQLSALLRYALESNQSELVPLSDEIQAVKDYLALESIRFEERLRVQWSIAAEACSVRVPPMLLQTLVENAIKHGIARQLQGGEVAIHARLAGAELQLEVVNSGEISPAVSPVAVGLKNAQERIKLLYGERASVLLENAGNGQVRALVKLPLLSAEVKA